MRSLSWKVALTSVALVGAGSWSCQKNQSSRDAASPPPAQPGQAPETQQPGGMLTPGMQQPSGQQTPGGQQSGMQTPSQQPGGQAAGASRAAGSGAGKQATDTERWPVAGREASPMEACPMFIEGTQVEASNTQDGAALTFTTRTGDVADLRQRVQRLAQMYLTNAGSSQLRWFPARGQGAERGTRGSGAEPGGQAQGAQPPPSMGHGHGTGGMGRGQGMGQGMGMSQGTGQGMGMSQGMSTGQLPPITAMVTEVADGARIELQPTDSAALGELREQVRQHAQRLGSDQCWMTSGQSGSATEPRGTQPGSPSPTQGSSSPTQGSPGQ